MFWDFSTVSIKIYWSPKLTGPLLVKWVKLFLWKFEKKIKKYLIFRLGFLFLIYLWDYFFKHMVFWTIEGWFFLRESKATETKYFINRGRNRSSEFGDSQGNSKRAKIFIATYEPLFLYHGKFYCRGEFGNFSSSKILFKSLSLPGVLHEKHYA